MDRINFDEMLSDIDRKEAELLALGRRLAAVSGSAQSADGLVEVKVGATGTVTDVHLAPETFRRSTPQYLGRSIVEAIQQATRQAQRSTREVAAPVRSVGEELTELSDELQANRSPAAAAVAPADGVTAASADHTVRVTLNSMGVVGTVDIAPDAYRRTTTERLAATITEAAERAARTMYESLAGAMANLADGDRGPDLSEFFPLPTTPEPAQPGAPSTPPRPTAPPAPSAPTVTRWNPLSGRPGETVVGPSDWDEDLEGYGGGPQTWLR
jgi:DNA-binding protein YbaB